MGEFVTRSSRWTALRRRHDYVADWSAQITSAAAGDRGTVRAPVLPSRSVSSPASRLTSSQRSVRISDLRQPVSISSRIAAMAGGHMERSVSAFRSAAPTPRYCSCVRNRSRGFSRYRLTARQGLRSRGTSSQVSASENVLVRHAIANMRERSIAGSVWTTVAGSRQSRMQPANVSARPSRHSASHNRTTPPSDEISPPSKSAVTYLRQTAGISNGSRVSSDMAMSRFRAEKIDASTTNFYLIITTYDTSDSTTSGPA